MSERILARTREEFMTKVKDSLKKDYKEGEIVDITTFSYKYGVRASNVKKAIFELRDTGYTLELPISPTHMVRET